MAVPLNEYNEGDVLVFTVTFTDAASGNLVDPTNVAFGYRVNAGAITSFVYGSGGVITRVSQGKYTASVDSNDASGTWVWEWQSTGVGQAITSDSFTVTPMPMTLL